MRAQRSSSTHHRRRWPGLPRAAEHQRPHGPLRRDPRARSPPPTAPRWRRSPRANHLADADLHPRRPAAGDPGRGARGDHHLHGALGRHPRARSRPATARRSPRSCRPNGLTNPNLIRIGQVLKVPPGRRPAPSVQAPAGGATTHVVRAGETLSGIASRYGIKAAQIVAANGLTGDRIYVGQQLRLVPVGAARSRPAPRTYVVRVRRHAVDHRPQVRHHGARPPGRQRHPRRRPRHDRTHPQDPGRRHRRRRGDPLPGAGRRHVHERLGLPPLRWPVPRGQRPLRPARHPRGGHGVRHRGADRSAGSAATR